MPEAVDILLEVVKKPSADEMKFRVSIKACFEEVTTPTSSSSSSSTSGSTSSSTSSSTLTSVPETSSSTSSLYTTGTTPESTTSTSVYLTPTTVCTVTEGMDRPKSIPRENIRDNNDRIPQGAENLRPNAENPFTVDRNSFTVRFLFNPAIPVESLELIRPRNIEDITVSYVQPRNNKRIPVVEVCLNILYFFFLNCIMSDTAA